MSSAFLNGVTIKRGDGESSEVFTTIPEVKSMSNMGKTNPLVEVTSFDSAAREYIAGLADGTEISLECNYLPADVTQQALIADVNSGVTRNLTVTITDGTTPLTYSFAVACLSWSLAPSYDAANMASFSLKISGDITVA
ncbi:MAG: hypothetical protein GY938_22730 [Ketobacter sp.]|nr:hypothetical protein [Ketobacter sp.]